MDGKHDAERASRLKGRHLLHDRRKSNVIAEILIHRMQAGGATCGVVRLLGNIQPKPGSQDGLSLAKGWGKSVPIVREVTSGGPEDANRYTGVSGPQNSLST